MEPKTIVAIVLVAFIIGGFIFLQVRKKNKKWANHPRGGAKTPPLFYITRRYAMNHLKKIEDRVISILKTNVDARSDDMMLYLLVCNSFYSNENSVGKMPFEVVMKNYKELELPHFESVRRTRAKIQSEHPELACSPECRKARNRMQHLYSNYVMN